MDELERAGRALRDAVTRDEEPSDRVRARARTIIRRRRVLAAGSIASVVIAMSVGVAIATRGGNGLGVHTIAPAGSTTTHSSVTRPTVTTTTGHGNPVDVQALPDMSFADALHGWRVAPQSRNNLEHTVDGGRNWTASQLGVPRDNATLMGVFVLDDQHVFTLLEHGVGVLVPRLLRTTDGIHWSETRGAGLPAPIGSVSFIDATHGWGLTIYGDPVSTSDGGDHWHAMAKPAEGGFGRGRGIVGSVCLSSPGVGWAATDQSVFRSVDGGASWQRQITIPVGGATPVLACIGQHAAYASFAVGAGQHTGAFMRTDDSGAHWRPLTEDTVAGVTTITAPGFRESQYRGYPSVFAADGTLLFTSGSSAQGQNWVVTASATDRFVVGKFDSTAQHQIVLVGATASDATHEFVETQTITGDGTGPRPVSLYASADGGHTWQLRWTGQ